MCLNSSMTSNTCHGLGHVTNTEKMLRLPGKLLYHEFFHSFYVLILIVVMLCEDLFLKGQILTKFQDIEIFVIFNDFEKGLHSYCYQHWHQLELVEKGLI